jgi:DNA-binding response OmpR family regulator
MDIPIKNSFSNHKKASFLSWLENEELELTKKEFDLLYLLLKNKNKVLTREFLLEKIWGFDTMIETNIVDVYISYLRAKVDRKEGESYIQTVRGTGYVIRD